MANNKRLHEVMNTVAVAHLNGGHDQANMGLKTDCGTTMCVAGWTTVVAGVEQVWRYVDGSGDQALCHVLVDGKLRSVDSFATEWLELSEAQEWKLFYKAQTYEDAMTTAKKIIEGEL